ncbi:MAG: peptide deformylase [Bacteroidales bacterium]|nr:peptide deformylase [Bacteroidales bacterium]
MILPIIGFGHPTLRKTAQPIEADYPDLQQLIDNMFETMYAAEGVGLAAPQVDLPIQLVVIGYREYDEKKKEYVGDPIERTLINPVIVEAKGEMQYYNEGCLSVPNIHEDVLRPECVVVKYYDRNFELQTEEMTDLLARIAQHEIDHLNGKVFVDRLSPLKRTLLKRKLNDIVSGKAQTGYRMKYVSRKK